MPLVGRDWLQQAPGHLVKRETEGTDQTEEYDPDPAAFWREERGEGTSRGWIKKNVEEGVE